MKPAIWTGMYAELPLKNALEYLQKQGWRHFEISTEHLVRIDSLALDPIDDINAYKRLNNLESPQAHAFLQADVADRNKKRRRDDIDTLERHLEICARLEVRVVVMHPGGRLDSPSSADRETTRSLNVEAFRHLGKKAKESGLQIALENLTRKDACLARDMLELLDSIGDDALGITLDTSHANIVGEDIAAMIRTWDNLLVATHISDNDGSGDQHLTPGNGKIGWGPVSLALQSIHYSGLLNMEIPGERHAVLELRDLKSRHAYQVAGWLKTVSSA